MKFSAPLVRGTLEQRYKRFLADITLENGETVTELLDPATVKVMPSPIAPGASGEPGYRGTVK